MERPGTAVIGGDAEVFSDDTAAPWAQAVSRNGIVTVAGATR
jgi:hypothetical protein